ncbi:MAG: hypothetical protein K1X74_13395 [Pirellulales bacterium]|nr:hypothetical protein [Pirellulales bacterium]
MLRPSPPPEEPLPPDDPANSGRGLWLVIAVVALVFGAMGALYVAARQPRYPVGMASISAAKLAAAEQKWRAAAPASYVLELELTGETGGQLELAVDRGTPRPAAASGAAAANTSIASLARVEDLFALLREDLAIVTDPNVPAAPGMAGLARDHMPLKAQFDDATGLPRGYARPNLGDNRPAFGWRVLRFAPGG